MYPRNNVFHADITSLPATGNSDAVIQAAGAEMPVRAPSSYLYQGTRQGIPINLADSTKVPLVDVVGGTYGYMSDLKDHPIPANPMFEGHPGNAWDRHLLILDTATCVASEMFWVTPPNMFLNRWSAASAVKLDLKSNEIRAKGSAAASGFSLVAGMIRYDEVAAGSVDHMVHGTFPVISKNDPIWPANYTDGVSSDPDAPPMGTVFRLKKDVDLSSMGPDARVIATALKKYGLIVADTGPEVVGLRTENSTSWDRTRLVGLSDLTMSDFEVVDISKLMVSPDSYEIR